MRYSAPLDGLRAIAILAVLVFHMSPATLPGGFIGVDVFYVLSGFLITSILIDGIDRGTFSFAEFYRRRIQRLLPNVIVTVVATVALWWAFLLPSAARQAAAHGVWALFSLSNVYVQQYLGGYWGNAAETAPLTHTWSLGVEEQFYLIYPASLVLLARVQRERLRVWLIALALASFALSLYATKAWPTFAFYMLPTRMWQLLAGAVLALPTRGRSPRLPMFSMVRLGLWGWAGLAAVLVGCFWISSAGFPGWPALVPTLGTMLVLVAIRDESSSVARLLAWTPFVVVGQWSYSIYLWHWPMITLGRLYAPLTGRSDVAGAIVGGLLGVLNGIAAYYLVEQPLRDRGPGRARRFRIIAAGFVTAVAATLFVSTRTLVADPRHHFDPVTFSGFLYDAGKAPAEDLSKVLRYYDVDFPPLVNHVDDTWRTGGIIHAFGGGSPRVVVLGSSHALMYSKVVDDICRERGLSVAFIGVDQRAALFEPPGPLGPYIAADAHEFDDARRRVLREWHPDAVLVIDRWDARAPNAEAFAAKLRAFVQELVPLTSNVIWLAQVPVLPGGDDVNQREMAGWRVDRLGRVTRMRPDGNDARRREFAERAEQLAADVPSLRVLRPDTIFLRADGLVRFAEGRSFFYADDDHLSDAGASLVRPMLDRAIAQATSGARRGQ